MNSLATLVAAVRQAGGRLIPQGDTLRVIAPTPLPDDLRQALRDHKAELLALLAGQADQPPAAGRTYCPACQSPGLGRQDERTICTACQAYWLPSIDLATDAPHATIRRQHPETGQVLTIGIYRCPRCRETRWGPRIDNPAIWCCLTCAGMPASRGPVCPQCETRNAVVRDRVSWVCFACKVRLQGGMA